jgi:hypothetical protein
VDFHRILPRRAADGIEEFVEQRLADAEKYPNSEPLDESGVFSLYRLAATIYAQGYEDGESIAEVRASSRRRRARDT